MRILAGLVATALVATSAAAADFAAPAPPPAAPSLHAQLFHQALPECGAPGVLKTITRKFAVEDANLLHAGLAIIAIDSVRQTAVADGPSLVDRRYCTARAALTNGRTSEVVFLIEGPMLGKYSLGYSVDSCLPAYDPFRVYDANCRAIRG